MGIDARIVVRLKNRTEKPSDDQLARWSWDLCRSVGASKFFIQDGLPSEQYQIAYDAWHAAFKAHPLFPQWEQLNAAGDGHWRAIGEQIRAAIGPYPNELRRAIALSPDYADEDDKKVGDGKVYYQDAEPIFAEPDEWLLRVSLMTRYYGIGYERGDLMTILAVAAWFETNISNCEVWYGGDSSDCAAEPLTSELKRKLTQHLMSTSGRDYFDHEPSKGYPTPKPCGLCIPGEPRFNRHGWGGNYIAVNCAGCGKGFESRDNGKTWTVEQAK